MILSILAVALLRARLQVNPPGTQVMPSQAAFYSAAGGTATVEIRNAQGLPVPFVDSNGVSWPNATITLPAATAVGLGWELTQTAPDSTHYLQAVGQSQYTFVVKMNCSATESPVGTFNSSAGAGNGIATGYPAPNATTPTAFVSGATYTIGYGSVITQMVGNIVPISGAVTANQGSAGASAWKSNGFSNLNSFSSFGEASNTVTTTSIALTLSGGGDPASAVCVIVTNTGSNDVWVSPYSGGHTWLCPAGGTTYIPSSSTSLYGLATTGSSVCYLTKAGY